MLTKAGVLFLAGAYFVGMLGCVSADVYRIKEQEALTLHKTNQDFREHNKSLIAEKAELQTRSGEMMKEKEGLQERIEKLNGAIVYLQNRAEELEKDGKGLRERVESLNAKIADLSRENQRLAALSRPENLLRTLGERLVDLQKQVESLASQNEKLESRQIVIRSEENKAGGAEAEMTTRPKEEKLQAVQVSAGQTGIDSKPDQQLTEDRKQPAVSEDPNFSGTGL